MITRIGIAPVGGTDLTTGTAATNSGTGTPTYTRSLVSATAAPQKKAADATPIITPSTILDKPGVYYLRGDNPGNPANCIITTVTVTEDANGNELSRSLSPRVQDVRPDGTDHFVSVEPLSLVRVQLSANLFTRVLGVTLQVRWLRLPGMGYVAGIPDNQNSFIIWSRGSVDVVLDDEKAATS